MEKMLVTQALNELKLLDDRITRAIVAGKFVAAAKLSETKVTSNITKEEFNATAKAALQSAQDLIERRKKIKAAVVASNAVTNVDVHGVTMTVAEAIERKSSIEYEETLLQTLKKQLSDANVKVVTQNVTMESQINKLVETAFGKDSKQNIKPEDYDSIAKPYRASNEYGLVDPLSVEKLIAKMEDDITGFKANVDSALQISNCTTYIEF